MWKQTVGIIVLFIKCFSDGLILVFVIFFGIVINLIYNRQPLTRT